MAAKLLFSHRNLCGFINNIRSVPKLDVTIQLLAKFVLNQLVTLKANGLHFKLLM